MYSNDNNLKNNTNKKIFLCTTHDFVQYFKGLMNTIFDINYIHGNIYNLSNKKVMFEIESITDVTDLLLI